MKIKNKTVERITTETYEIEYDLGVEPLNLIYIDYLNEKGKVIDSVLRYEDGTNCDDPFILEQIQELVD